MAFTRKRRKALKVNRDVQKRTVLSENERRKVRPSGGSSLSWQTLNKKPYPLTGIEKVAL